MSTDLASVVGACHRVALTLPPQLLEGDSARGQVSRIVRSEAPLLDAAGRAEVVQQVLDRLLGLGPLEAFLAMPAVNEVMINGPGPVWVEEDGVIRSTQVELDRPAIDQLVERIVAPLGRRLDRSSPLVDGRLPDGSRVHVAAPPVAIDGPYVTVRRFQVAAVELEQVMAPDVAALLRSAVAGRSNIVVSGGTGSGKTTLLNSLAGHIGRHERIVTVEDAAELRLRHPHVVRLESRPRAVDGPPEVTIRTLVRNALRMRPDRIVVGEVRGGEALDMVQAMNTGHEGSLSTVHANGPTDALSRLQTMVAMADAGLPIQIGAALVAEAVDLVVHLERSGEGGRRVVSVVEPAPRADDPALHVADAAAVLALPRRPPRRARAPGAEP